MNEDTLEKETQEDKDNNVVAYNDIDPEILERANLPIIFENIIENKNIITRIIQLLKNILQKDKKKEGAN